MVSSADECANDVYRTLTRRGLAHDRPRPASHRFWTTGHPGDFAGIGRRLMGGGLIEGVEQFAATPRP
jgi:glutamate racemase